ncbi:hypothetical protein BRAS3809_6410003 [Bradyrhizobium sp. STM 3809]|nr:hypothetical protein BRAS3809_6410003 [Bradyrhizobium sp. STM 3809]
MPALRVYPLGQFKPRITTYDRISKNAIRQRTDGWSTPKGDPRDISTLKVLWHICNL